MSNLIDKAQAFAAQAHSSINQRRKYTGEPYIVHPQAVAAIVSSVCDDEQVIAAAWLHDTVEDTAVTLDDIRQVFGGVIAELVRELTNVSVPADGCRAKRKAINRAHSSQTSSRAKTIKLADVIDNIQTITAHDPAFAKIYLTEKKYLIEVLKEGDKRLYQQARTLVQQHLQSLEEGDRG